jgi:hypothetical protein
MFTITSVELVLVIVIEQYVYLVPYVEQAEQK